MIRINLLPDARQKTLDRFLRARKWAVGLGASTSIITLSLAIGRIAWTDDRPQLQAHLSTLQSAHVDLKNQLSSLKEDTDRRLEALNAAGEIGDEPDWSILLALIADRTGEHIVLTQVSLEPVATPIKTQSNSDSTDVEKPRSQPLVLSGIGTSAHQVSLFSVRLEELDLFDRVVIAQSERSLQGQLGSIRFTIRCQLSGEGH